MGAPTTPLGRFVRRWRRHFVLMPTKYFRGYCFIHINKTGGSSIEHALGLPLIHMTAREYRDKIGARRWERRFSFAIVRNPWDRAVSHYHYRVLTNQTALGERELGFGDWVRRVYVERAPEYVDEAKLFLPQWTWVADADGTVMLDYIGRFEDLQTAWDEICDRLGRRRSRLPHLKKSPRGDYRDYYDAATRRIISDFFAADIEHFGYSFD